MRRTTPPRDPAASGVKTFAAASIGNLLEIYDFIAYGIFAVPISRTFFATHSDFMSLLLTFITFAVGFVARPLGALVLGRYADRAGRRRALSLTLLLMAAGTLVPAVCPSYAAIGIAAPVIVACGRLLQGFSAGGEIGGAVALLVENAPESRKGFASSFQQMSQGGGAMLAGLVGLMLTHLFTDAQITGGAWRLAFVFGLLIGPVGWYVRRSIPETAAFERSSLQRKADLWPQLVRYRGRLLGGVGILVFWTIATYVSNYFTTYAVRELHLSLFDSYLGQLGYGITMVIACPVIGALSDRVGVRKPMLVGALVTAVAAYPLFWLLAQHPSRFALIAVQMTISLLLACYAACASNVLASFFPVQFRATGVGFSYATGVTIFGGLTPLVR
ncbi:MFS transporter [Paraburkholderia phosphatilytica]|uniref:MFS transporter n=1 Tax=Paraburkholderia phosphatilytica TaxID=2282883 RepID=UPI000E48D0D3|nr:MFS transporter [Paraburkholderia phosphatilytica]